MSEVINKYLDFGGLQKYDLLIKDFIAKGNDTLADKIDALTAKIGNIDVEGSDSKTLAEIVGDIYASIAEIVEKQGSLDDKDGELEDKINGIIGDLESLEGSDAVMTLVEISNKLKAIEGSVSKNADDIAGVAERVSTLEGTIDDLKNLGGENGLVAVVDKVNANVAAIEKLNGEADVEGSVKKAAADAQAAAIEAAAAAAAELYQAKGDYESAGAAAQALVDAKAYVDAISHASDVKYEDGFIKLYDAAGAAIGKGFDASPFIVDGMIDTVDFVTDEQGNATTTLRFTFNIDSADSENNKKVIDVDFAKYVDVYKGDNTSIVLDSASKTFSVNEVAATKTKTVESIPVAGGPLAKLFEKAGINVSDIAAGSSVEDVLFSLLCKELWAQTLTFSEGTVASSIAQPSFTLENSGKTVEVGTKCTLSEITMSAATASVSKNRTYSGFTYGYSAANDNAQNSANTSITAGIDVAAALNDGNYTMSRDYTQFNGASDDSATANADASQVKLDGAELTVSYVGSNSVKVTVGGPTASATFAAMPVYYACSNLKKTKDAVKDSEGQYKSDAKDAKKVTSGAASNSKTLTVTGARAYWTGSVKTAMTEFTSATVRAAGESDDNHLTKALGTNVPATVTATGGDAQVIIATQKEITEVFSKNQIGANVFGNFNHHTVNIEGANGFTGIRYHVYEWAPANPFDKDDILTITYK